jgi:hypothetical protein
MSRLLLLLGLLVAGPLSARAESLPPVDVALVIALDISASVDASEYRLQMRGLADALRSEDVRAAIAAGPHRRIAVAVTQWSGTTTQFLVVPWTILGADESLVSFASHLRQTIRADSGDGTSISAALIKARALFHDAPPAARLVVDVAADGINNMGPSLPEARADMKDQGITVNGLAVSSEWPKLKSYLEDNVITGPNSFALDARSYDDFGAVMLRKLVREIQAPVSS